MKKERITMIEAFSGIGAQVEGTLNTGLFDVEVLHTCDLDKDAMLDYAIIHCDLTEEMIDNYENYPSREDMAKQLTELRIGYDFQKEKQYDWFKVAKKKTKEIEKYWLACKVSKNLGDICKVETLPYCDILTYSFPCTDISMAGRQEGMLITCKDCGNKFNPLKLKINDRNTCPICSSKNIKGTRSGCLVEVERILENMKKENDLPKYLLLENVKALVNNKNIEDFNLWCLKLEDIGYNTYWKVLNGKECGIPQNRERVFAISIRKDIDNGTYTFPKPFDLGVRLKDVLDGRVDEKYYVNTDRAKNLIGQLLESGQLKDDIECCDSTINDPKVRDVCNCIIARYDAGIQNQKRTEMAVCEKTNNINYVGKLEEWHQRGGIHDEKGILSCLTATDYKTPKLVCENVKEQYRIRKLTPEECWFLMGFKKEYVPMCRNLGVSNTQLYRQAGNSIITTCIKLLMEHLYKAQYDFNYICTDEKFTNVNIQNPTN